MYLGKAVIETKDDQLLWEKKLLKLSLDPKFSISFLQTSKEREFIPTICCTIKSILECVAKSEKEIAEISDKVRVIDENSAEKAWERMILTIDGINEPELSAVTSILPDLLTALATDHIYLRYLF